MKASLRAGLVAGLFFMAGCLRAATVELAPVKSPVSPVVAPSLGGLALGSLRALALSQNPLLAPALSPSLPVPQVAAPVPSAAFGQRLAQVQVRLAAPLAAAADADSGAGASREAAEKIEQALTGAIPAATQDLPPAGPISALSDAQESWLHDHLTQGPQALFSEPGFRALLDHDPEAMGQILGWLQQSPDAVPTALSLIYQSLARVVEAPDLSGRDRAALGQGANDRFAAAILAFSRSEALSKSQRETLTEVHDRFLANYAALNELTHHRQASARFSEVRQAALSLIAPSAQQDYAEDRWVLQPSVPAEQRGLGPDREASILMATSETERNVKEWGFFIEKDLARYRIAAQNPRFSQGLRENLLQTLSQRLGGFFATEKVLHSNLERVPGFSLLQSFVNPKAITARARGLVWIPDNRNLRLVPEPGGYRVEVTFETQIQDVAVLKTVKDSIEEYWRGQFDWRGEPRSLRVVVTINKLAAGQAFSEGSLHILDSRSGVSHATRDTIVLDRNLRFDVPAHEFGHILGFNDEYREGYDPDLTSAVMLQNPASIMGAPRGKVLPRHLKTAYQLLRRRSLAR